MDSTDAYAGFSSTPAAQPEEQQDTAPQQGGDAYSGFAPVPPSVAAKATAAGTTTAPDEAGSTYSAAVKAAVPPDVVKADPAAFQKDQNAKAQAAAIDSNPTLAHFINTVPDGAAITEGDQLALAGINASADDLKHDVFSQFIWNWIAKPVVESAEAGVEELKQSWREGSDPDGGMRAHFMAPAHLIAGAADIGFSYTAPFVNAYSKVVSRLTGIPEDQVAMSLFALSPRYAGRALTTVGDIASFSARPTFSSKLRDHAFDLAMADEGFPDRQAPIGEKATEEVKAKYADEATERYAASTKWKKEIDSWTDDEVKQFVNDKMGFSSAATHYAETQRPEPGMDKSFDEFHVEQSNMDKDTLDRLVAQSAASKTRERSPEAAEAYNDLRGMGDKEVSIPAQTIADIYGGETPSADDGKFGWVSDIAQRLSDASELGSEISIPLSKYLANVDPAMHSQVKDLLRVEGGLNPQEAKEWIDGYHDEYAEDAEKEDIENMAKDPDERLPSNSGPQEWGVENFLPMREDIKAKPGANTARLAKLLGPKLYGEPSNMDKVTVKELLQNAYDAIKGAIEQGMTKPGQIVLDLDQENRVIRMIDNGTGMHPEVLGKEFLEIAGTKKETTQASGGLGIAKMLVNFANKGLHVQTMRDGKVSELNTHGEELMAALNDPSLAPTIKVSAPTAEHRKMFPEGHGTYIEVTIPESYVDTQTGEKRAISFENDAEWHPVLARSPLFGNLSMIVSHPWKKGEYKPLRVGRSFPIDDYTQFPPAQFEWGNAQIFVSKNQLPDSESWQENLHIHSNGIWQFSRHLKINPLDFGSKNIPYTFHIDVHPKVAPEDAGYPFDLNRQGFTRDAEKSMDQVLNYLAATYRQLDFLSQAKSYGHIVYLSPGKGKVDVSPRTQLEPKTPPSKTSMTGLKSTDKIEFKNDALYVNGKKMPSMKKEDLAKAEIKLDELMVDAKLIDPNRVMLHSSMETLVDGEVDKDASAALQAVGKALGTELRESSWRPLDEVAREKFGPAFDQFMYEVGDAFLRIRDAVVRSMGADYAKLGKEAIGISFDSEYRGVSIRVPFSGSFVNPALPVYEDPIKAAVGTIGTMIHELAHFKVRSHDAEFPAEMQKIQIWLDVLQMYHNLNRPGGFNLMGVKNALAKTFETHKEIFNWLRATILDESRTRTLGRRIKGTEQRFGEAGPTGDMGGELSRAKETADEDETDYGGEYGEGFNEPNGGPVEGRPAQSADIDTPGAGNKGFHFNVESQLANILLHTEKKSLYLAPLFKDAKSAGMTQKQFTAYAKKLQAMDEADYEKALAYAHKEVQATLTPAYKAEYNEVRQEVESDLHSSPEIAANRFFRTGQLPSGEHREPPKLDRTAVEYMGGTGAIKGLTEKGGLHPDDAATGFGFESGRELVQALTDFDRSRGRKTPESYINQLIDEETNRRMQARHGDIRERLAERAQEIALENHHVDILVDELKHLARMSGQLPFTKEQIERRVKDLFNRVPYKEAKYHTYQKAVFKAGRYAEEHLLAGKFDKAFKSKQTQLYAVHAAKLARTFESYRKSQERTFKRLATRTSIGGVAQEYVSQAQRILNGLGYIDHFTGTRLEDFKPFVDGHNGSIAAAAWIYDPSLIRRVDGRPIGYKDMNVEEFTALAKTIQSIMHNGREESKIAGVYGKANLDDINRDIINELLRFPDKRQPAKAGRSIKQAIARRIRWINAKHMLVERMLDDIDQFDPNGPLTMYLDRPFREAYNDEIKLAEASVRKLKYIANKYTDNSIYDKVANHVILDPLDSYHPYAMNRRNLRELIRHMGSQSGLEKILKGFNISEDQLNDLVSRNATVKDIEYANEMWDLHDQLWRRSTDMQYRVTGVEADPLEKRPFDIKLANGETVHAKGGHSPVRYDREGRSRIEQDVMLKGDLFDKNYRPAATPQSYTIPRTNYFGFLDLSGELESSHLMQTIHDIAFREAVLNARKLILGRQSQSTEMRPSEHWLTVLGQKLGHEKAKLLLGWLKDIANSHNIEDDYMTGLNRWGAVMQQNITASLIFLKPTVMVKHGLSAMGMSAAQVGARELLSGMYDVGTAGMMQSARDLFKGEKGMEANPDFLAAFRQLSLNPNQRDFIYNSSPMMRARRRSQQNTIRAAIHDLNNAGWKRNLVNARLVSMSIGRLGVAMSDALSADAEWTAAYKNHFQETGDHNESVFQADRAVTRAHGSNFIGDRPEVLRTHNAWVRNLALLYTYWNHYWNNMLQLGRDVGAYSTGREEPGANVGSIGARIAYLFVTVIVADVIAEKLFTHNKEPIAELAMKSGLRTLGSGIVGLRELTNWLFGGYEPTAGAIGVLFKNVAYLGKDLKLHHPGFGRDALRHLMGFIGMAAGIGGDQLGATSEGVANLFTGAEKPRTPSELTKQLVTGHPRPAR